MKQRLFVFFAFVIVAVLLVGLNAVSYVQKDRMPDTEAAPNRSTFNSGATGTQALYTLLYETGRNVIRWQRPLEELASANNAPSTLVIVGPVKRDITDDEITRLLEWVSDGGTLVLIDRAPPADLMTTTSNWKIWVSGNPAAELVTVDPLDKAQMTKGAVVGKFVQPTWFGRGVNAVQPSRFASWVGFERNSETDSSGYGSSSPASVPVAVGRGLTRAQGSSGEAPPPPTKDFYTLPTPTPVDLVQGSLPEVFPPTFEAPVVHMVSGEKNLLVDVPFGEGTIIYLTDPYIVSNAGIGHLDNAQLAINILGFGSPPSGPVAFDEYHHGYGANNNRLLEYFDGTPVIAVFLQVVLVITAIFYSRSRRFARPLPDTTPDRLSKLEYVSAMADMQRRLKAYDLAMENIYVDFRRRSARSLGVDHARATRSDLARLIAERTGRNAAEIEELMYKCESIMHGEPSSSKEITRLAAELRKIENDLGVKRARAARI